MGGDVRASGVAFASWVAGGGEGEAPMQSSAACATY
jgi:hypothetical protein